MPISLLLLLLRRNPPYFHEIQVRKTLRRALQSTLHTFQFPNGEADRTSVSARCRHSRVLRDRAVLYSSEVRRLDKRDVQKSKLEKHYDEREKLFNIL